ncbi:11505_t:CDS:10 [Scutellospora calospora]|uniref:11505_t:CDS:1 n=1 Tax=Scutellospora calospora TaxID=85575 RepID=A0ACA9JZL7_9GLOM|nr:11505_t:CDS:10 [Scutellospora calospora]
MEADSDDEIYSRDSQQSSDAEGRDPSPFSDEEYGIDETLQPFGSNAPPSIMPNRKLQPFADDCKTYDIIPLVAAIQACHIHSLDVTKNMRWVFTGGEDGFIRKYDFFSSMRGKTLLTQNQKHTQVESVQKAGVILSYWENEEIPISLPVVVKPENPDGITEEGVESNVQEPPMPELKMSSVYSLAVQSEAVWLLSGLELAYGLLEFHKFHSRTLLITLKAMSLVSGAINLFTVRHEEGRCHHVMRQHKSPVSVLKITSDETSFVSGSWDKSILHWDLHTGLVAREYSGHNSQISSIAFRPITHSSPSSQASIQSSPTSLETVFEESDNTINHSRDILLTTSIDGNCFIWDRRLANFIPRKLPVPEKTPPWCLSACWSADGNKIYCGRRNGTVDEWDFASGKFVRSFKMPSNSGPVSCVASMPNGKHIVCASTDNIRLWNVDESETARSIVPFLIVPGHHGGTISQILIDPNCRYMITTSGNRGWEGSSTETALFYEIIPIV